MDRIEGNRIREPLLPRGNSSVIETIVEGKSSLPVFFFFEKNSKTQGFIYWFYYLLNYYVTDF